MPDKLNAPDDVTIADIFKGPGQLKIPVSGNLDADENAFTAEEYVQHVLQLERESRQASDPIRRVWDKSWNLYNNAYDFSQKANWQSKNFIPRVNMTVRASTFMIKKALLGPAKSFYVEGFGQFGKLVAFYMDKLTTKFLERANWVIGLTDSLHAGMLSSLMVLKCYPTYAEAQNIKFRDARAQPFLNTDNMSPVEMRPFKKLHIRIDPVDPYHVHLDPSGGNKYLIHDIEMDMHELKDLAKNPENGFDLVEINRITEDMHIAEGEDETRKDVRAGQAPDATNMKQRKKVLYQEYWGDLWSKDGNLIARNITYGIANQKYLIKKPVKNKLPHKGWPFIVAPVVRKPFSVWHQGFVEIVGGLQVMMTELMNLTMDSNLFASAKAFEIDIDQVYDPTEFLNGIYPGKTFKKRGGGFNTAPMIKDVSVGQVNTQTLSIFNLLNNEYNTGLGLNEFSSPSGQGRGRTTATEVIEKTQSTNDFMQEIASTTEDTVIIPLLDMIFHYVVEYNINFEDPELFDLFKPEEATQLSIFMQNPAFRQAMHQAPIKFKARGLSTMIGKLREMQRLAEFVKLAQAFPEVMAKLDPEKVLARALESMGWYPQELMKTITEPNKQIPLPNVVDSPFPNIPQSAVGINPLARAQDGMSQVPNLLG